MAVVLAATGLFLYVRLGASLGRALDDGLRARAADVAALVEQSDTGLSESTGSGRPENDFAQVLDERGRIVDATPEVRRRALLSPALLARARRGPIFVDRLRPADDRLLARPVRAQEQRLVIVVGTSLEPRAEALAGLRTQLLVGGPLALLVASFVGYGLAAAALRPVEAMRRRATAISAGQPGQRLPVSRARDEVRRLAETLNEMLARLELALTREREFVADASHELRSPLALVSAEVELALAAPRNNRELTAALRSIGEETDRLTELAEDLLLLAHADNRGLPVRAAPFRVDDLFSTVTRRFARRAADAGRRIETTVPAGAWIVADRLRVEQALSNLIENALRHSSGIVELAASPKGGFTELHVVDDGAGFPKRFLPSAFGRFTRADEARARGGTGLGLAIVAAIARAHGGTANALNRPGRGADLWFTVPSAPEPGNGDVRLSHTAQ